jgi:beta-catenin-like protein 1
LPHDDIQRLRLVRKFAEDGFEKVDRLFDMLEHYHARDEATKKEIEDKKQDDEEDEEDMAEQHYLQRLGAGLFTLQRVCLAIAVICEEDERIREHAMMLLNRKDRDMNYITSLVESDESVAREMEAVRGPVFASALNGESEEKPQDAEMTQATASTIEGDQTNNN